MRFVLPSTPLPLATVNWDCLAPKKVKVFFWFVCQKRTRTRASLHRHDALDSPDCPFCHGVLEQANHLFATCPRLAAFWTRLLGSRAPLSTPVEAVEAICDAFDPAGTLVHTTTIAVLWVIWKAWNTKVFRDVSGVDFLARNLLQHVNL